MSRIEIPNSLMPGFERLRSLKSDEFTALLSELSTLPLDLGLPSLEKALISKFDYPDISSIVTSILSLGPLIGSTEVSEEELAKKLAISFSDKGRTHLTEEEKTPFEEKLLLLLKNIYLRKLTFKANYLLSENQRIFIDCHIITDLRLIFQETIEQSDRKTLILHQCKITFEEDNKPKEFYFSMDLNDLEKLKKQIDRAIEKEKVIKKDYSNISFFEIKE
jgi:mRNA-degrading endonuclease YafQ of YafQ-DinJ toxin-antitoxin module